MNARRASSASSASTFSTGNRIKVIFRQLLIAWNEEVSSFCYCYVKPKSFCNCTYLFKLFISCLFHWLSIG